MTPCTDRRSGLTLVELMAVLFILALVAGIAITSTEGLIDQARVDTSQKVLANLEDAIIGPRNLREPDGTLIISGFLADIGRLPQTVRPPGQPPGDEVVTLGELWDESLWASPTARFAVRKAEGVNIVGGLDADTEIWVACGWRGPYLRLPVGSSELSDGWGKRLVSPINPTPPDPTGANYHHIRDVDDNPITAPSQSIHVIRSLGSDRKVGGASSTYEADLPPMKLPPASVQATLSGDLSLRNPMDGQPVQFVSGNAVEIWIYCPDPANVGKIKVIKSLAGDVTVTENTLLASYVIPVERLVTPGPRVLRAYFKPNLASPATMKSPPIQLTVRPGLNLKSIVIDRAP